ncbi:MAG TPA: hypothetical protein VMV24_00135 [Candidatus Dormibacteraeota bacterium]|nr:hypothetical protein [Candidatus Dormibacteraeota bacterium]
MEQLPSHNHDHTSAIISGEPSEDMYKRLVKSSVLRFASSAMQIAAGLSTGNYPLIIEGAEELTDGVAYAAGAKEIKTEQRGGLVRRARSRTVGVAIAAASFSTIGVIDDTVANRSTWAKPMEGLDFSHNDIRAAAGAVALSSAVLFINWRSVKSNKPLDRWIFIDSAKDFIIPSLVLLLPVVSSKIFPVPQYGEYVFEAASASVGWWNTQKLYKSWMKIKKSN